jgi:hypothetical protein
MFLHGCGTYVPVNGFLFNWFGCAIIGPGPIKINGPDQSTIFLVAASAVCYIAAKMK